MVQPGTRRYRGFAPVEISQLHNGLVLLDHADAAATKWVLRAAAVESPRHDLIDLARLDANLEAQLDALCVSMQFGGAMGVELCATQFEHLRGRGEAFAAMFMAARLGHEATLATLFEALDDDDELAPALASALGWSAWDAAWPVIETLWKSGLELRRTVALAALTFHARDPSKMLDEAIQADAARLRARAARTIGELGIVARTNSLRTLVHDEAAEVRYFAARSLALLGDRDRELAQALSKLAEDGSLHGPAAACLSMRLLSEPAARAWFDRLIGLGAARTAIAGAAAQGSPSFVAALLNLMSDDELAAAAGAALSMVTGVDLEREDLDLDRPEDPRAANEDLDDDDDSPLPDPERVRAWWAGVAPAYDAGRRYLAGLAIDAANLQQVLTRGNQAQRHAAAVEQVLLNPGAPLYRTRQSGLAQVRELLGWT